MARGRRRGSEGTDAERTVPAEQTNSKFRACMSCSIIKTFNQFTEFGCENCPFMDYEGDRERVGDCTTNAFTGMYVLLKPKDSWVAKWQRMRTLC